MKNIRSNRYLFQALYMCPYLLYRPVIVARGRGDAIGADCGASRPIEHAFGEKLIVGERLNQGHHVHVAIPQLGLRVR